MQAELPLAKRAFGWPDASRLAYDAALRRAATSAGSERRSRDAKGSPSEGAGLVADDEAQMQQSRTLSSRRKDEEKKEKGRAPGGGS